MKERKRRTCSLRGRDNEDTKIKEENTQEEVRCEAKLRRAKIRNREERKTIQNMVLVSLKEKKMQEHDERRKKRASKKNICNGD